MWTRMMVGALAFSGCGSASWTDTFQGTDTRTSTDLDASLPPDDTGTFDASGDVSACAALAKKPPVSPITVTFPNYNSGSPTIHVVAPTGTCDMAADNADQGVLFADATSCAALLAPGPGVPSGTATASGSGGPNDLHFQWTYGLLCEVDDDYALSKQ